MITVVERNDDNLKAASLVAHSQTNGGWNRAKPNFGPCAGQ